MPRFRFSAVLLLLLFLPSFSNAQDEGVPGKQVELSFKTSDGADVPYLLYLPESRQENEKPPVVLFLHGRGESFGPLSIVAKWGPPRFAARGEQLPYILVSPQCPKDDQWKSPTQNARALELLDTMIKRYDGDTQRVYLTGLSMGGYGTWSILANESKRFAAASPICGGGDPAAGKNMVDIPIWVFHGDQDRAVPFSKSVEMVEAIRAAGGEKIRFTTLEEVGHNSWSAAYATPELFHWMLKHRRKD